jgi:squalene-hopene/tetraprenyl-beta-curcumene cyclase
MNVLPDELQKKCRSSVIRMLQWMRKTQASDGSWTPLWFGDQDAEDERSPVYGTAMTVEYLAGSETAVAREIALKGLNYILSVQNTDGGWGGAPNVTSKVTLTARALSALATWGLSSEMQDTKSEMQITGSMNRAFDLLYLKAENGVLYHPEPIGLYFSRLWYSEELYNLTFVLNALKKYKNFISDINL